MSCLYSNTTWQGVVDSNISNVAAYAGQGYGTNQTTEQYLSEATLSGAVAPTFLSTPKSESGPLPSVNGEYFVREVPAGNVEALFALELTVNMQNYTGEQDPANSFFTGIVFLFNVETATSLVGVLRSLGSQYVCTGDAVDVTLLSAAFNVGTQVVNPDGSWYWSTAPGLTSVVLSVAGLSVSYKTISQS
jgi:hypothetical protein